MLKPLNELYVSNEFLTNFTDTWETPPEWWTDNLNALDLYLLARAGHIGVNDNILIFIPAWLTGKTWEFNKIYEDLRKTYDVLDNDIDINTIDTISVDEHTETHTIAPVTDGVRTRTIKQDITTERANDIIRDGEYINDETENSETTYESTNSDPRLTSTNKRLGGTTEHVTSDATNNEEKITTKREGYTDTITKPAYEDEDRGKRHGHEKSPADIIRNDVETRLQTAFLDVFTNAFIHDLTSGIYMRGD